MFYTESEIVRSYLQSGRKASQIKVLAELNATGIDDESIRVARHNVTAVLKKNGVLKQQAGKQAWKRKKAVRDAPDNGKKLLPATIPPKVKAFDRPVKSVDYWQWETGKITDKKIKVRTEVETESPNESAAGEDEKAAAVPTREKTDRKPDKKTDERAAGVNEPLTYTAEEFRKGFLFMANFVADCITAMDGIDPDAPDAEKKRAAYIRDIESVQEFLSEIRIKRDDDTGN